MNQLPVINCDNCGACCLQQCSPPSYVIAASVASEAEFLERWPDAKDYAYWLAAPEEARQIVRDYIERCEREGWPADDAPCVWLDLKTLKCRFYEHRPLICRELEVGSEGCRTWRDEYNVDVLNHIPGMALAKR